ncbi:hypothetical protein EIP91_005009 [Steccherinum ochraceum]|uniref:Uncharacterized protein n=1 Tax=Steccherinum ochraceum TaxID=92696 RepID=A0A4R0RN18_9APHY|nr:hypothetical protein EIP91_005009 [Steccherinum ochraceum]
MHNYAYPASPVFRSSYNNTNTMTTGLDDLPLGGQIVIYLLLAMLIVVFAAGIFSVFYPPLSDAENVESFFNLDSFDPESPEIPSNEKGLQ